MSIQPRTSRRSAVAWLRPALVMRRRTGHVIAFLFRTPVLLAAMFVAAIVLCVSMLLTVDRGPADALTSGTAPASGDCVMFCSAETPTPQRAAANTVTTTSTDGDHAADEAQACWMFCEPSSSTSATVIALDGPPGAAAATAWHLGL